jgi:hypothetical protein
VGVCSGGRVAMGGFGTIFGGDGREFGGWWMRKGGQRK